MEVHFPANTQSATVMEVYFNGVDARVPDDRDIPERTTYWFRKK